MIWNDPWLADPLGSLPPDPPELPIGVTFRCVYICDMNDVHILQWRSLVGTKWSVTALQERLAGAWVTMLVSADGGLIATCVLRPRSTIWLLETFVAKNRGGGDGTLLVRHAIPWAWSQGCRSMVYTWELGPIGLGVAWWRGWLHTAVSYDWGWVLRAPGAEGCSFCPSVGRITESSFTVPVLIRDRQTHAWAILSDSGLHDGWGYVLMTMGPVDWPSVIQKGGWRALWYRGAVSPASGAWRWTGETVVTGVIGTPLSHTTLQRLRLSPEVAHS